MKKAVILIFSIYLFNTIGISQNLQQINIQTNDIQLVLTIGEDKKLYQSYFGEKLNSTELPSKTHYEAYIAWGTNDLFEPALRVTHADGNPAVGLEYDNHNVEKISNNHYITRINMKDDIYPVKVTLFFATYLNENVIRSWTEISHSEKGEITLSNFASSMLHFKADDYWLTQFHGDWAAEMRMQESQLTSGIKIIDSKLGSRAHMYQTPVFFLSLNKPSTENTGNVLAGTLEWSGNFQFLFELDNLNSLRVISGMNPFASEYYLKPNVKFTTPAFVFTYSPKGKGLASRNLHSWARNYGVLDGNQPRMTLLNNWEATYFDFNEEKLNKLFGDAKNLGVDLFLLDDGWFANKYPRNSDTAGLGDWEPNHEKLPNGIAKLVKDANDKGVKFGIWIEPEMVNPKSELYEQHPEWILKLPKRDEHYFRSQLVLDLSNPTVQEFVYNMVNDLLTENPGIAYIKWDCNRMMTNTYSTYLKNRQSHIFIDYQKGLYTVLDRLRAKYPHLPMMLCSGGGGRTDYGALKYFTEFWPSDNTDGLERVYIQWGYSYFFPSVTLSAHVTSWGKQSIKFRTDVAMQGRLGYDINVEELNTEELEFSKKAVQTYKRISPVIWQGDLFRLISPYDESRAVLMYVTQDKNNAVLFSYTTTPRYGTSFLPVKLEGLNADKKYTVKEINVYGKAKPIEYNGISGDRLMKEGITVSSNRALSSRVFEITAE